MDFVGLLTYGSKIIYMEENNLLQSGVLTLHLKKSLVVYHKVDIRIRIFLILINDLPKASKFFTILIADDTTLQLSLKSLHDLYDSANFELSKIEDWFKANKLTLNESNTEYILYKNKKEDVSITSLKL